MGKGLSDRLAEAVIDAYRQTSSKRARYRPRNPDQKPLGAPRVRVLPDAEREKLRQMGYLGDV